MNVLHTISSLGVNSGGPPLSTTLAVKGIRKQGINTEILTYNSESGRNKNISNKDYIHYLPPPIEKKFAYSKLFKGYLQKNLYDIYHCQGIWQYPTYIAAKHARKFNRPYVITLRGMLYPQQLQSTELHKKLAMSLYLKRDLEKASCIHATCDEEMRHLRDLGIVSPVAIIPNPIDTNGGLLKNPVETSAKRRFGYLGRIHSRKNVEHIIYAWDQLRDNVKDSELIIIGDGDKKYLTFLKDEVKRLNLSNIEFTGFLSGRTKEQKLASLSYLIVPSDFENFGMIIGEALVRGIPVIASKGTPWKDLETKKCGWWVDNDVKTIRKTMNEAFHISEKRRIEMGKNGKELISQKYTMDKVGKKLGETYRWLLGEAEKPDFVYFN